jgi:hypothetical protein
MSVWRAEIARHRRNREGKHKIPPSYSRAEDSARSFYGRRDDGGFCYRQCRLERQDCTPSPRAEEQICLPPIRLRSEQATDTKEYGGKPNSRGRLFHMSIAEVYAKLGWLGIRWNDHRGMGRMGMGWIGMKWDEAGGRGAGIAEIDDIARHRTRSEKTLPLMNTDYTDLR